MGVIWIVWNFRSETLPFGRIWFTRASRRALSATVSTVLGSSALTMLALFTSRRNASRRKGIFSRMANIFSRFAGGQSDGDIGILLEPVTDQHGGEKGRKLDIGHSLVL